MSIKIHHMNCATFNAVSERFLNGYGKVFKSYIAVTHCLLLETNDELILVDTGFSMNNIKKASEIPFGLRFFFKPSLNINETAFEKVIKLGYNPEDVKHIIVTHLDVDHANGISDFPWAKVHTLKSEFEASKMKSFVTGKLRYKGSVVNTHTNWELYEKCDNQWFGYPCINLNGISEEVFLLPLCGHSKGNCAVIIKQDKEWLVHAGDCYMNKKEIETDGNKVPTIGLFQFFIQYSSKQRKESLKKLRDIRNNCTQKIKIICSHDFDEFKAYEKM